MNAHPNRATGHDRMAARTPDGGIGAPPRLASILARLCLHEVDCDVILGDLEETYARLRERNGVDEAKRWYWSQVIRSLPGFTSRTILWSSIMLKNYATIALRNMRKQKGYAFINVFGLAIGIAFCALIFLFIRDEVTYDRFHANADNLYRVNYQRFFPDGSVRGANPNLPIPAGPAFRDEIPGVLDFVRLGPEQHFMRRGDRVFQQPVLYADPSLLSIFSFPLKYGDPETALSELNSVVLTEEIAKVYFGTENPLGQTIDIRVETDYESFVVTGVARNVPGNSTIQFDVALPFERILATDHYRNDREDWEMFAFPTYVSIAPNASIAGTNEQFEALYERHYPTYEQEQREQGNWDGDGPPQTFAMQRIDQIHLSTTSDPKYSYILTGIALAILLIACINFMTLAIGRSASRGKEVGIRKVIGAQRRQVAGQFWSEAVLMSGFALLLGLLLAQAFLPVFNDLSGKSLRFDYLGDWSTIAMLSCLVLFTGLAAGSYPALVLSRFRPIEVLKTRHKLSGANPFTKSLVVVQFTLSVFLIIGTLVMQRQMEYVQTRDLGYDKEHVIVVRNSGLDGRLVSDRLRTALGQQTNVIGISASGNKLGYRGSSGVRFSHEGERHNVDLISVEANFLELMGITLVQGRDFDPMRPTDSTDAAIVNEALVRDFNLADPVGKPVPGFPIDQAPTIVGVTEDFNFQVLYQEVGPLMLSMRDFWGFRYTLIRIAPRETQQTIAAIDEAWTTIAPDVPFSYFFLDEDMQANYRADQRWSTIINYASIFAVVIACMGLFGLVSLTVASRTKEIGIRKVLGARTHSITLQLSKDFVTLVVIGILIAVPVGYLVMERWLETFAFRVPIGIGVFIIAALVSVGVAAITVSYQSVKAALANPVDSLRYE